MTMWDGHGWMMGMHYVWWLFWLVVIVAAVVLIARRPSASPPTQPTPLEILERRYAAGEITTEEFDERKAKLLGITR